jgi:signal recognition particle subunit SEC65
MLFFSWVCVYPCYIDADKSAQEGRKIAKEKSVKNPHAYHMAIACQKLGFSVVYEVKYQSLIIDGERQMQILKKKNYNSHI